VAAARGSVRRATPPRNPSCRGLQRAARLAPGGSGRYHAARRFAPVAASVREDRISRAERAYFALGSNLGDRGAFLDGAIAALEADAGRLVAAYARHETPALLLPNAPPEWNIPFLNQVIALETELSPRALLSTVKTIERRLGRTPSERWAPREIDIDILAVADRVVDEPDLTVPHRELHRRRFVLDPWSEIAPEWRHPIHGETVAAMRARLMDEP